MTNKIFYAKITSVARICWRGSMAEQLICNQQVDGSTPFASSNLATIFGGIPERPKGADCKSVVTDFAGPNPASPTKTKRTPFGVLFVLRAGGVFGQCSKALLWRSWRPSDSEQCRKAPNPYLDPNIARVHNFLFLSFDTKQCPFI